MVTFPFECYAGNRYHGHDGSFGAAGELTEPDTGTNRYRSTCDDGP